MYYTMGEVSEMFDVSASLIRYWEKHFTIIKPVRNKKGNRLFTPADVENFKKIYHLVKERGMTLEGAQKSLRGSSGAAISREVELMDRLLKVRSLLLEVRQELKCDDDEIIEEPIEEVAPPVVHSEPISLEPADQSQESAAESSAEVESSADVENAPKPQAVPTQEDGHNNELFAYYEQKLF